MSKSLAVLRKGKASQELPDLSDSVRNQESVFSLCLALDRFCTRGQHPILTRMALDKLFSLKKKTSVIISLLVSSRTHVQYSSSNYINKCKCKQPKSELYKSTPSQKHIKLQERYFKTLAL